ncbi:MAG: Biosynthetic Aromatic amino acid aminotransferase alpha [Oscillospiraceae bacterium]|nr:Biosynthetic Aromatic amino acid aminotransferase alpha [Oscillospiraceae bacterium]
MANLPSDVLALGTRRNVMREIFEYGKLLAQKVGAENVFDYSLGNPSVAPPASVNQTIRDVLDGAEGDSIHAYTSAQGDLPNRELLSASLNRRFGENSTADDLYFTMGAAAALTCCFHALTCPGDEYVIPAPYFTEYQVFIAGAGGKVVESKPDPKTFQPDLVSFEAAFSPQTKGVVINSPNNPSGVVYSKETLAQLTDIMRQKAAEYGHPIYLISDEPYREIVFDGFSVPWLPAFYDNTLVCYSYSKSLSLPGERIGYVFVSPKMEDNRLIYAAVCGAGRKLGYVNAPALFQRVAALCDGQTADIAVYQENRNLLYSSLTQMGFTCVEPGGTFYLLIKSMEADSVAFCERAREFCLLLAPADSFSCPGYARIAFCVPTERIRASLPAFQKLADSYQS